MSVIVKYGSAFTPVSQGTKQPSFSHPFSIKSLLNLDESSNDMEQSVSHSPDLPSARTSVIIPTVSQSQRIPQRGFPVPLRYEDTETNIPAWIYATRYCRQGIPPGTFINVRRPRKPLKKHKQRPLFSQKQIQRLEEEFSNEKYISKSRRSTLATEINLTDAQVRTWFQNRRTRWRKEVHGDEDICLSDVRNPWQIPSKHGEELPASYGRNALIVRGYCCS